MIIKFKKLTSAAIIPTRKHDTDSGMDICSTEAKNLGPGERYTFATGIAAEIPDGYELQVRPRSGLSSKGIDAKFGTVDRGYTGEIRIILVNNTMDFKTVGMGERIAQLVLAPVAIPEIVEVDEIADAERGANGFGSTGIH